MIRRKGKKVVRGEVLSFVRTFARASRMHKRPSEERMVKGIMRQIERKGLLKKSFKTAWGRPPTPAEIHALRTGVVLSKKIRPSGTYSLEEEKIILRKLDPRTIMHEWTHMVELSHLNNKKRLEYLRKPEWNQRVESELYGVLSEVASGIAIAQKTGRVISPLEKENPLKYGKKKLSPKEKQRVLKETIRAWMQYFKEYSTPEAVRKIASKKRRSREEFAAYAQAHKIAYKVLENILKKL